MCKINCFFCHSTIEIKANEYADVTCRICGQRISKEQVQHKMQQQQSCYANVNSNEEKSFKERLQTAINQKGERCNEEVVSQAIIVFANQTCNKIKNQLYNNAQKMTLKTGSKKCVSATIYLDSSNAPFAMRKNKKKFYQATYPLTKDAKEFIYVLKLKCSEENIGIHVEPSGYGDYDFTIYASINV